MIEYGSLMTVTLHEDICCLSIAHKYNTPLFALLKASLHYLTLGSYVSLTMTGLCVLSLVTQEIVLDRNVWNCVSYFL